jgi:hypothetical protein
MSRVALQEKIEAISGALEVIRGGWPRPRSGCATACCRASRAACSTSARSTGERYDQRRITTTRKTALRWLGQLYEVRNRMAKVIEERSREIQLQAQ